MRVPGARAYTHSKAQGRFPIAFRSLFTGTGTPPCKLRRNSTRIFTTYHEKESIYFYSNSTRLLRADLPVQAEKETQH